MLLVLSLFLLLVFAGLVTAIIRPPTRPAALLCAYLLIYTNIVLVGEATNALNRLNQPAWWLVGHLLLALISLAAWLRVGKPALRAPWVDAAGRLVPQGWQRSLRRWPELWVFAAGVLVMFCYNAALIWHVPPNNNDSLATHMSRVAYWVQRGSFLPWPTERVWQVTYPVNMQLQVLWTVLFTGGDRWVEMVQWIGALIAMAAVFGIARLLGAGRAQAAFAGLLFATFPEIILESTSTQNDLVAGTLFAIMIYLLFLGLRTGHRGTLALSGLALALGWGTKQTLFFLLPGLSVVLLLVLLYRQGSIRQLVLWGFSALAAFLLAGAYMFLVNQVYFGTPMGPETAVMAQTGGQQPHSLRDNLTLNATRLLYQAIDPTGLPDPLTGYGFKAKALVVGKLADWLGYPIEGTRAVAPRHEFLLRSRHVLQEDAAWYGPLFAVLVLPGLLVALVRGLRRKDALWVGLFLLAFTFWIMDAALRPGWDPFQGRYFIPVVATSTALAAFVVRRGWLGAVIRVALVVLALVIALTTVRENIAKPVNAQHSVWTMDRTDLLTLQSFYMREAVRMVDAEVPGDATLAILSFDTYLEYPFFGPRYQRRLVQVSPPDQVHNTTWMDAQGAEYLLLQTGDGPLPVQIPPGWRAGTSRGKWTLFVRENLQSIP